MPAQLRCASRYQRARARWLWQMSWAALWIGELSDDEKDEWRVKRQTKRTLKYDVAVDDLGYPMPLVDAPARDSLRTLDFPDADEMWELMRTAAADAPADVRDAFNDDIDDDEIAAWWGAHMGAPLLPSPVSIEAALRQSLSLSSERDAAAAQRLPGASRLHELIKLIRSVPGVGH